MSEFESFVSHLECSVCKSHFSDSEVHTTCKQCGKVLLVRYKLQEAKKKLNKSAFTGQSMWRYAALLPIRQQKHIVSLAEGGTPLVRLDKIAKQLGLRELLCKDESFNPTSSFKARGLGAAVSKAFEHGTSVTCVPTAGNAGSALAAYAAAANMEAHVFMPRDTPQSIIKEHEIYGAKITFVDGTIADAAKKMNEVKEANWFDVSTLKEPYRLEGKKTLGYEIAEQLNWSLPDVIVYPTGGGTGLIGMWKAFDELEELGWLQSKHRPKMVAVQAAGCAPVVTAYKSGQTQSEFCKDAHTYASGLRVPKPFADYIILDILKKSDGRAIAVSDEDIERTVQLVARTEGLFLCPEGAATVFALHELIEQHVVEPHHKVVVFNTASGLKYL